jgi:hypothetical protein
VVHQPGAGPTTKPLCGGGNGARGAQWQEVLLQVDCRRCLAIQEANMPKRKKCRRCGCTDERACDGGCSWVADIDVCSACLTDLENAVYDDLVIRIASGVRNARRQMKLFGQMIVLAPKIKKEAK